MKKQILIIVLVLILVFTFVACTNANNDKNIPDNFISSHIYTDSSNEVQNSKPENENNNLSIKSIDPFENLIVSFKGWDNKGKIIIDTTNCSDIKNIVTFAYDNTLNGHLKNGSYITIKADYDTKKFSALQNEKVYEVTGLYTYRCYDYHEGLAWVYYGNDTESYWGCIDKSGKMLFQFDSLHVRMPLDFSDGYAFLLYDDILTVINTSGDILSSYPEGKIWAWGDGYTVIEKYTANFDTSYYTYTIYDRDGKTLDSFNYGIQIREAFYCGKGVFGFVKNYLSSNDVMNRDSPPRVSYCIQSKTWITWTCDSFYKDNEIATAGIKYFSDKDYRAIIYFMNPKGEWWTEPLYPEYGWDWTRDKLAVNDNACVLYGTSNIMTIDLSKHSFYKPNEYWMGKIMWDKISYPLVYDNGRIALPLKGSDNNTYMAIFDKQWNVILEPIQIKSFSNYSDGRLIVNTGEDTNVYDENGNIVFKFSEKGYSSIGPSISPYSDGIALVKLNNMDTYIDKNGKSLFDEIDTSNVLNK